MKIRRAFAAVAAAAALACTLLVAGAGSAAADPSSNPGQFPTLNPNSGGTTGSINLNKVIAALVFLATLCGLWVGAAIIRKAQHHHKPAEAAGHGLNVLIGWTVIGVSLAGALMVAFSQSLLSLFTN